MIAGDVVCVDQGLAGGGRRLALGAFHQTLRWSGLRRRPPHRRQLAPGPRRGAHHRSYSYLRDGVGRKAHAIAAMLLRILVIGSRLPTGAAPPIYAKQRIDLAKRAVQPGEAGGPGCSPSTADSRSRSLTRSWRPTSRWVVIRVVLVRERDCWLAYFATDSGLTPHRSAWCWWPVATRWTRSSPTSWRSMGRSAAVASRGDAGRVFAPALGGGQAPEEPPVHPSPLAPGARGQFFWQSADWELPGSCYGLPCH